MDGIYGRVLELMGTTPADPLFARFVEELSDPPVIFLDSKMSTEYQFPNSGLELSFMKGPNCFTYSFFHFRKPKEESVRTRWKKHYSGDLPGGIDVDDGPTCIREKLGLNPISSKLHSDPDSKEPRWLDEEYDMPLFKLTWTFRTNDQKLSMLSLCYKPANDWVNEHSPRYMSKNKPTK